MKHSQVLLTMQPALKNSSSTSLPPSVIDVLSSISDERAISMFKAVALSQNDCTDILISKLKLTRKQYYSNMERLMHAGLIKRKSGRYSLTSLGNLTFDTLLRIETAIQYYWKLKALDIIITIPAVGAPSLSSTDDDGDKDKKELALHERNQIIDMLIDNDQIKATLTRGTDILEVTPSLIVEQK